MLSGSVLLGHDAMSSRRWCSQLHDRNARSDDSENFGAGRRYRDYGVVVSPAGDVVRQAFSSEHSQFTMLQDRMQEEAVDEQLGAHRWSEDEEGVEDWVAISDDMIPAPLPMHNGPTTLLVRNVCRRLHQRDALKYWPNEAYNCDLFYVLFDHKMRRGAGRIIINFLTHERALDFRNEWHDQVHPLISRVDHTGTVRRLHIEAARRQGFQPNFLHYLRALDREVDVARLPAIFIGGQRYTLMTPTKSVPRDTAQVPFALGLFCL